MKAYKNIYDEIISLPNLYYAYSQAIKSRKDATLFGFNKDIHGNLWRIHLELLRQTYEPSTYTVFHVKDYKERRIMAPHFRDHVVHHAIHNWLEQIYDASFIYDSYACRKGKGTHKGFFRVKKFAGRHKGGYFMKCDITKYFYSIDQHTLLEIIRKNIKDESLLGLLEKIIGSHNEKIMPYHIENTDVPEQKKGIPIGNLTSQLFANIYLNELDYFAKHELRIKHYVRYVDDFIMFSDDKKVLHEVWEKIRGFLHGRLYLCLEKRKTQINKVSFGVDFTGYVARGSHVRVRTRNWRRFRAKLGSRIYEWRRGRLEPESLGASFASYTGHLSHTNSGKIKERVHRLMLMVAEETAARSNAAGTGTMPAMPGCFVRT